MRPQLALADLGVTAVLLRLRTLDPDDLKISNVVREHIANVLDACEGNRSLAAPLLGIPRRTLQRWLNRKGRPKRRRRGVRVKR